MSKSLSRMFSCPKCGKEYEIAIWESINVQLDPDLREKLLHNEVFKCECPHCHEAYQVLYPCLYHDPDNKIMIWLVDDKIQNELESIDKIPFGFIKGYTYRYCKNLTEFVEKVRILEEGLDDRIIEMAKMYCENQIVDTKRGTLEEVEYSIYNLLQGGSVEIVSVVKGEEIRMQLNYAEIQEVFEHQEDGYSVPSDRFVRLNREWMLGKAAKELEKKNMN